MASKTAPGLLKAIEDFRLEHGGDKEHESNIAMLERVHGDIQRGKSSDTSNADSPGRRETMLASEAGHDAGHGNKTSNAPGKADVPENAADMHLNSEPKKMTSGGPAPSGGNIRSALAGPAAASGQVDIRRMAALSALESKPSSEGNKESVAPAPEPSAGKKMGDVRAPAKEPPDRNTGFFEGTSPPYAKESLSGDGWTKARERAKKLAPAAK